MDQSKRRNYVAILHNYNDNPLLFSRYKSNASIFFNGQRTMLQNNNFSDIFHEKLPTPFTISNGEKLVKFGTLPISREIQTKTKIRLTPFVHSVQRGGTVVFSRRVWKNYTSFQFHDIMTNLSNSFEQNPKKRELISCREFGLILRFESWIQILKTARKWIPIISNHEFTWIFLRTNIQKSWSAP